MTRRLDAALVVAVLVSGSVAALLLLTQPRLLLGAIAAGLALICLLYPWGRVLWITLGGVVTLGGSSGASAPKLAWFAGLLFCALVAWRQSGTVRSEPWAAPFRRVFLGSWVMLGLLAVWAAVGLSHGATITDVLRDGLNYALIVLAPLLALDAARHMKTAAVDKLIVVVSLAATVGFAITFITRRGVGTLDVEALLLPSNSLMALGVALGTVRAAAGERLRWRWMLLPPTVIAGQLVTGTRTGFLLVLGVVGALGRRSRGGVPLLRLVTTMAAAGAALVAIVGLLANRLVEPGFLEKRFAELLNVFSGGFASDQSGVLRLAAQEIALRIWHANPTWGLGLGAHFPDPTGTKPFALYTLDTPAIYLAKFGVVGLGVLLIALGLLLSPLVTIRDFLPERTVMRAWLLVMLGLALLNPATEDKGFGMTLLLLLLLIGSALRQRSEAETRPVTAASLAPEIRR